MAVRNPDLTIASFVLLCIPAFVARCRRGDSRSHPDPRPSREVVSYVSRPHPAPTSLPFCKVTEIRTPSLRVPPATMSPNLPTKVLASKPQISERTLRVLRPRHCHAQRCAFTNTQLASMQRVSRRAFSRRAGSGLTPKLGEGASGDDCGRLARFLPV